MIKSNLRLLFALIIALLPIVANCQLATPEGSLSYDVSIHSRSSGKLTGKAKYYVSWKGAMSRTEMKSSMGTEFSIYDSKSGKGNIFKEYSGQKLMIPLDQGQWKEKHENQQELHFQLQEGAEMKAGRNCRLAVARDSGGREFTVWYDPTVIPANLNYDLAFKWIPGLPVCIMLKSAQFEYTYLLSSFQAESIPMSIFEADGKGYRTISYGELKKMKRE